MKAETLEKANEITKEIEDLKKRIERYNLIIDDNPKYSLYVTNESETKSINIVSEDGPKASCVMDSNTLQYVKMLVNIQILSIKNRLEYLQVLLENL